MPIGLRALAHRDYRLFWAGQPVSLIGTWMQSVGQSYARAFVGASPFGSFLVGAVAERFGVPAACTVGGRCGLALVALLAIRWRRRNTSPEHPGSS
jgi:hypothetical protein